MRPPRPLQDEMNRLYEEFFSLYPDEERVFYSGKQSADTDFIRKWVYDRSSKLLRQYMDYRNWIGEEGQLCDGKGNILLVDSNNYEWILEWDVNDEGYCVFKGTQNLILNTDGKPIRDPVLDPQVEELYLTHKTISVEEMVDIVIKHFPEQKESIEEATDLDGKVMGHLFASLAISTPMIESFYKDEKKFEKYCKIIELLWHEGDDDVLSIIDVTILEDINNMDETVWKGLGKYLGDDLKRYINKELTHWNILMSGEQI